MNSGDLSLRSVDIPQISAQLTKKDQELLNQHHDAGENKNTQRAKRQDLKSWSTWCLQHGVSPITPEVGDLCLWISHMGANDMPNRMIMDADSGEPKLVPGSALSMKTIDRRLSSVRDYLKQSRCETANHKVIKKHLRGIKTLHSRRRLKRAKSMSPSLLRCTLDAIEQDGQYKNLRDRCMLLLGFSGALRVSDLSYLQRNNLIFPESGKGILLQFESRKAKTDLSVIEIYRANATYLCPVATLENMLNQYPAIDGNPEGKLFRSTTRHGNPTDKGLTADTIARIIKTRANNAGLNTGNGQIQGHSLRRGYIDTSLKRGIPISEVMKTTGHSDPKTLMLYLQELGEFSGESLL